MSQNITFKIQDIKCEHLPKSVEAFIEQAFSVKLLLGGKEYGTGPINGSSTTSWSNKISLQAPESASLEIEVHNHINGHNKLIGSLKDTVHNLLKESSSVVRTLRKMDGRGVIRETTVELTFSIALLSQDNNTGLLVSSLKQLEQPDTKSPTSVDAIRDSDEQSNFVLFVGTVEWTRDPREQEDNYELYVEVKVGSSREVHRTMSTETAHWDQNLRITGHLSSIISIEIKNGAHNSSESLSIVRADTSLGNLLEICADGDVAALELTIVPLIPEMLEQIAVTNVGKGSKHSAPDSMGFMTMGQLERRIPEEVEVDLESSIFEKALALTPDGHLEKASRLSKLAYSYHTRFERLDDLVDLENSITTWQQALALTPDGHRKQADRLLSLGDAYDARFERLGDLADLENAIANFQQAVALTPDSRLEKASRLSKLGDGYHARFERLDDLVDLDISIVSFEQALTLTPDGHLKQVDRLLSLGDAYDTRFERLGDLADLENAITNFQQALALTPDGHPDKTDCLSDIGDGYHARFERLGDLADLNNSITAWQKALTLTPDGHPDKRGLLSNLGAGYLTRFRRLDDLADLENSITTRQQALALTPDGHREKASRLSNIGAVYHTRFERLADLADLENSITTRQQALALTPDGHLEKASRLSNLGASYDARFERLGDPADLENAIANFQQALALTPDSHLKKASRLSKLAYSYRARFRRLDDISDVEISITSFEHAVALTPDGHPDKPGRLSNLSASYDARFERLGDLTDLENALAHYQKILVLTPDGHPNKPMYLSNLGASYHTHFERLGDLADLENSITTRQKALALTPDGHSDKPIYLSNLANSYRARFERLNDFADLENSITTQQQALALSLDGHPNKPNILSNLGLGYLMRFGRLEDLADLEKFMTSFEQALALTPDGHPKKPGRLTNLGGGYHARFERLGDLADLENTIASWQEAVRLTPAGHPDNAIILSNLGGGYRTRFERLGDLADLENSITTRQQAVAVTPGGHPDISGRLSELGSVQLAAFNHYHEEFHLHNALSSIRLAAQSPDGSPHALLVASRNWANLSLWLRDIPSALQALRTAIEILPQVAWLGLDIASQQDWLAKEKPEELGCMAATCAIRLGRFEEAVELLDIARSVFWQQASSVRKDQQDLKAERPELARELEAVSQKLDTSSFSGLSTSSSSSTQLYEHRLADHRGLVLKRESLIKEIRSLPGFEFFLKPTPFNQLRGAAAAGHVVIINISKLGADALVFDRTNPIRHIPLSKVDVAKSFKPTNGIELKQTRADGTQDQQLSLTLPELWDSINVEIFKPISRSLHGASGKEPNVTTTDGIAQKQARADVTEELHSSRTLPRVWEHILKPIFTEVGILLHDRQDQVPTNRIFWYLTGPLTFIPIHAAGPVSQLVVSSYVTTLSSLAEAQKRQGEPISGPPRLLAITQPDTPGQAAIPYATDEVNNVIDTLLAKGWRQRNLQRIDRADATIDQVSTALNSCSWVHFACHAMQHASDGMESAFALHDGRLKLSVIAAKRLASARFAFLSTCQSASGLQDSPGEAMHLSAGMQFAGFSSVIATMSSIRDEDAPIVAKHTYTYLLRNGLDNVDLTEGAAALNYAVSRLREDPTVTVDRWAPFVYYGV